jgi:hypothetical protein
MPRNGAGTAESPEALRGADIALLRNGGASPTNTAGTCWGGRGWVFLFAGGPRQTNPALTSSRRGRGMMFLVQLILAPVMVACAAWLITEAPGKIVGGWRRLRRVRTRGAASAKRGDAYVA